MEKIKIPAKKHTIEYEMKKSRFIATVEPLTGQEEVKKRIREIRDSYPGCRHVVYAFFTGDDRAMSGLSDDGEPHGTAGRPVYEVLKGSGLTDVLLTVTRYFGGTKLGTGGLVSAYGQSAKNVLEALPVKEKIYTIKTVFTLDYSLFDGVKKILADVGALNVEEEFSTGITIRTQIPMDEKDLFAEKIRDISRGEISPGFFEEGSC
ncbi:IMPACT family protein [Spirochaeta isovalerica]|uniref:Putative YigZ family protein n=1 Tax=Spirochaeta isovalerica TaxID=150 RepID=A0A841RFD8_9SPIO|nr:YigZ family protein [Spirochaeta isovalerica]MBB6482316.1 putative YigZ family protein [Spirochaeta isovalerica]